MPILILLMIIFSIGLGLWLSSLSVQYRDVKHAIQFVSQLLMYAAPVVWPLSMLIEKYGDNIKFRIDANQAYSIDNFIYLCNKLKNINIEYIEEPLLTINKENLKIIKDNSNLPIAIDESIFQYNYRELVESKLIDYAIIKPSLYGGIKSIFKLVQYLKKYNIKIILSSGLHTIIGNLANIHIASALESINHHGLNNYPFFHLDKKAPYGPNDSMINVNDLVGLGVCNDD